MRAVKLIRRLVAIGVVAVASTTALAQEYYPGEQTQMVPVSAANLAVMSQRIEALEASLGLEGKKDGGEDTSGQKWTSKWGGEIMGDTVMYTDQNAGSIAVAGDVNNYFEFRRLRLFTSGEGYGIYDYKFQIDLEPEHNGNEAVAIKDMYFGIHEVPMAGYVRFGHYKAPFSLEELTSSKYTSFMERSLPNIFTPQREVGVTSYNHSTNQNWTWAGGMFFDSIPEATKERIHDNQGTTVAGRTTWTPYYDEPSEGRYLLHFGLNGRYTDDQDDSIQFTARPEVHESYSFISTPVITGDWYTVTGPEAALVWGPFSVQAEYMATRVDDHTAGITRDFHSAYVFGSWFLTGENRTYSRQTARFGRTTPNTNFWVVRGAGVGTGAVELLTRWSYLDLSGTTDRLSGSQNDVTFGVNWYWNPHIRWMFNYIHSWNEYDNGGLANAENDIFAVRGQVDF